jgi:glycosyltransferase involved in cell wall biosynthesis
MLLENNPYPQDVRVRAEAESLSAAGYRVEVVAPRERGQPRTEHIAGVLVRRFRCPAGGTTVAGLMIEYLVAASALHAAAVGALLRGTDVLHLHNPPDILFPAGALFRVAGRRVLFDHHDLSPETVAAKFGNGRVVRLARIAERLTFAVANHVLATNESFAEIARDRGGKAPPTVSVVRNAPPDAWIRRPLRVRPGALDEPRLVYVGALSSQDGADAITPVLARLHELGVRAHLTVIGDGDARPTLESQLRAHGLAERVTFTGWVDWQDVPGLVEDADVCLDPAPPGEANSRSTMIKIAEYLSLGKPIVAFDLLETRRTAGDAALFAPTGDLAGFAERILALAADPDLRLQLARRARKLAEGLVWSRSEQALLSAYRQLCGDPAAMACAWARRRRDIPQS